MYRIDNSTASATLPPPTAPGVAPGSYFTDVGTSRTIADAEWLTMVQEEISNVITDEGALDPILNKNARNQLLMGIRREVNASGGGGDTQPDLTYLTTGVHYDQAVPMTSDVIAPICSIPLPAGNWLIWGHIAFNISIPGQVNVLSGCLGVGQNNTWVPGDTGVAGIVTMVNKMVLLTEFNVGCKIISLPSASTLYLLGRANYNGSPTVGGFGFLAARAV